MRKVMKTIKVEKKKKKSGPEKTCLEVLHEIAKAMSENCEIEIHIIHPDTKIHLVPTVDDDENDDDYKEDERCCSDPTTNIEAMKQLFKGDGAACCGSCCDHPFADMGVPETNKTQDDKTGRAEAGESM